MVTRKGTDMENSVDWRAIALKMGNKAGKIANGYLDLYCELINKKGGKEVEKEKDAIANRWWAANEVAQAIFDVCIKLGKEDKDMNKELNYEELWKDLYEDAKDDLEYKRDVLERYLCEGNYDEVIRVASELKATKIVLDSMDWFEEHQKNKEL